MRRNVGTQIYLLLRNIPTRIRLAK